jgi:hypothetical protein
MANNLKLSLLLRHITKDVGVEIAERQPEGRAEDSWILLRHHTGRDSTRTIKLEGRLTFSPQGESARSCSHKTQPMSIAPRLQKMTLSENCSWRAVPVPTRLEFALAMVWPTRPKLWLRACPEGSVALGAQPGAEVVTGATIDSQMPTSGLAKLG